MVGRNPRSIFVFSKQSSLFYADTRLNNLICCLTQKTHSVAPLVSLRRISTYICNIHSFLQCHEKHRHEDTTPCHNTHSKSVFFSRIWNRSNVPPKAQFTDNSKWFRRKTAQTPSCKFWPCEPCELPLTPRNLKFWALLGGFGNSQKKSQKHAKNWLGNYCRLSLWNQFICNWQGSGGCTRVSCSFFFFAFLEFGNFHFCIFFVFFVIFLPRVFWVLAWKLYRSRNLHILTRSVTVTKLYFLFFLSFLAN